MSGIWDRIKAFFRRKKEPPTAPAEPVETATPPYVELKETRPAPKSQKTAPQEAGRSQKPCPKCAAPNDTFVHKCWLCKAEV